MMLAAQLGLGQTPNGFSITAAQAQRFKALVTLDTNLRYQQHLAGRPSVRGAASLGYPCRPDVGLLQELPATSGLEVH